MLNLRRYIAHIELVHARDRLTAANWDGLLVPACTHPDAELVHWLLEHGARPHRQLKKLMTMTVGSREQRLPWIDHRIVVLEVLARFCSAEDTHLSEALAAACASGNIGPAAWLVEHGADIHFTSWNAFRRAKVDCLTNAEVYGERTGDLSLYRCSSPGTRTGRRSATGAGSTESRPAARNTMLEERGSRNHFLGGFGTRDLPVDKGF